MVVTEAFAHQIFQALNCSLEIKLTRLLVTFKAYIE